MGCGFTAETRSYAASWHPFSTKSMHNMPLLRHQAADRSRPRKLEGGQRDTSRTHTEALLCLLHPGNGRSGCHIVHCRFANGGTRSAGDEPLRSRPDLLPGCTCILVLKCRLCASFCEVCTSRARRPEPLRSAFGSEPPEISHVRRTHAISDQRMGPISTRILQVENSLLCPSNAESLLFAGKLDNA